jgi:hypothetical protein
VARNKLIADYSLGEGAASLRHMKYSAMTLLAATLCGAPALAGSDSLDTALGEALGGGLGAYVGSEVGGRQGAVIGGALGGATGAAVTTTCSREPDYGRYDSRPRHHRHHHHHRPPPGYFCPPGQAKKGNC